MIGKLFKTRANLAGLRDYFVQRGLADQFFAIHADDGSARRQGCAAENGAEPARHEMFDQAHPGTGIVQQRTTCFHKNCFSREPKIGNARRDDGCFPDIPGRREVLHPSRSGPSRWSCQRRSLRAGRQWGAKTVARQRPAAPPRLCRQRRGPKCPRLEKLRHQLRHRSQR